VNLQCFLKTDCSPPGKEKKKKGGGGGVARPRKTWAQRALDQRGRGEGEKRGKRRQFCDPWKPTRGWSPKRGRGKKGPEALELNDVQTGAPLFNGAKAKGKKKKRENGKLAALRAPVLHGQSAVHCAARWRGKERNLRFGSLPPNRLCPRGKEKKEKKKGNGKSRRVEPRSRPDPAIVVETTGEGKRRKKEERKRSEGTQKSFC